MGRFLANPRLRAAIQVALRSSVLAGTWLIPNECYRLHRFGPRSVVIVLIAASGLTMAVSMAPIAKDLKIEKVPVELFGMVFPALVFALSLNRICDTSFNIAATLLALLVLGPRRARHVPQAHATTWRIAA